MGWMSAGFAPHRFCLASNPSLVTLHVLSDAMIFIAYSCLSVGLLLFVKQRVKAPFDYIFRFFAHFIFACGCTHLMGIIVQWYPVYWLDGIVKLWTAVVSLITAYLVVKLLPIGIRVSDIIWTHKDEGRLAGLQQMVERFEQDLVAAFLKRRVR